jgi:hypothetical protein
MTRQAEAVVGSLRWDPPVTRIERGPAGMAAASHSLGPYLVNATMSDEVYGCFPTMPGGSATIVDHEPGGLPTRPPTSVICSTELAPTPYELWAATLTMSWGPGVNRPGGSWRSTVYINGDGEVVGSSTPQSDRFPGGYTVSD